MAVWIVFGQSPPKKQIDISRHELLGIGDNVLFIMLVRVVNVGSAVGSNCHSHENNCIGNVVHMFSDVHLLVITL